ncbi:hypothetical protein BT96DRAFT_1004277 [Gymnopus androsaceus JB14]|uniref:Serine/threonine-protein kinase TOR n=1 Tax=Gymnopus androsaceus JB14 TaxID=1447944 RepID=A0A6A4GRS4_9AGAR|nr:hypothetical protein BT96DRAFT_1004277 [Gymnopus androsaceus JB14]
MPSLRNGIGVFTMQHAPIFSASYFGNTAHHPIPMLNVLLCKANDPNPNVAAHIMLSLGELTCAVGESVLPHIPELIPDIMAKLSDNSLIKRDAALTTLGQVLWKVLRAKPSQTVRREVIKVLGILGAVDPYRRKDRNADDATSETAAMAINQVPIIQPGPGPLSASGDYFQTVSPSCCDRSDHVYIRDSRQAFLPQIIPAFAIAACNSSARYQEFHLQQLAILGERDPPAADRLIKALGKALNFWDHTAGSEAFGANIKEYLHLVIHVIVKSYERIDGTAALRKRAIQTIDGLPKRVNFSDHASRIVHPLLGSDFAIFVPTINKAVLRNRITHTCYEGLISKLLNGERLPQDVGPIDTMLNESTKGFEYSAPAQIAKMVVNWQHLKQAWDTSDVATREDWTAWMHKLSEIFNAAFLSCWTELYDQYQEDLIRSIETTISAPTAPSELIHWWLDLAEFMEHEEKPLPIEHCTLGEYALKYLAYAKALHHKELEYWSEPSTSTIEALISINTRLQWHDAAWGTSLIARDIMVRAQMLSELEMKRLQGCQHDRSYWRHHNQDVRPSSRASSRPTPMFDGDPARHRPGTLDSSTPIPRKKPARNMSQPALLMSLFETMMQKSSRPSQRPSAPHVLHHNQLRTKRSSNSVSSTGKESTSSYVLLSGNDAAYEKMHMSSINSHQTLTLKFAATHTDESSDSTNLSVLGHSVLDCLRLLQIMNELSLLLVNMRAHRHKAIAGPLCSAIWSWIDHFPDEFNEVVPTHTKMEGASGVFDFLYNKSSRSEHILWPTLAALQCIIPERTTDLQSVGSHSNQKLAKFTEDLMRQSNHTNKLGTMLVYDNIAHELKSGIWSPVCKSFWECSEEVPTQGRLTSYFLDCLEPERSDAVKLCVIWASLTLIQEESLSSWQKPLDELFKVVAPLMFMFYRPLSLVIWKSTNMVVPQRAHHAPECNGFRQTTLPIENSSS